MKPLSPKSISPIGIGTWGIGGYMEHDSANDDATQIKALRYTLEKGINYIDTATMYGGGYSLKLIRQAIKDTDQHSLFINAKITGEITKPEEIQRQVDFYLKKLDLEYLDSIMLHAPWHSIIPLEATFEAMQAAVETKKVRFLSISNCHVDQLKLFKAVTGHHPFGNEVDYNFEVRVMDDLGVVDHCQTHNIRVICYQSLRRNLTAQQNYPIISNLAKKYNKTHNQIILNWLTNKPNFLPLVKSDNRSHIDENIASTTFTMNAHDHQALENHRIDFDFPKPDIHLTGQGLKISNFSIHLTENIKLKTSQQHLE